MVGETSLSSSDNNQQRRVFISYSDKDLLHAERLYEIFESVGLIPWMKKRSLRLGQKRDIEVKRAIKESGYFIALLSKNLSNKDKVHKDFKIALDVREELSESAIFIMPVRLDDCEIPYHTLEGIEYADLFPDWKGGLKKILTSLNVDEQKIKDVLDGTTSNAKPLPELFRQRYQY
jgi:hypothetical protein